MSPREAADRLFNRVMQASEGGNQSEALEFAPMALGAYQMVPVLDADAHFHIGLINAVSGDLSGLQAEIRSLREFSPTHLLAYDLAYRAEKEGTPAAEQILNAFSAALGSELATGRPEYQAHRNAIEKLRQIAFGGSEPVSALAAAPAAVSEGTRLFGENCARCHGLGAVGTQSGPPLIHKYYEPSHHADEAFFRAVTNGVKSHHWRFGDMPPIEGLSRGDVEGIVSYVREQQRMNGIF